VVSHLGLDTAEPLEVDGTGSHFYTLFFDILEALCLKPALPFSNLRHDVADKRRLLITISSNQGLTVSDQRTATKVRINLVEFNPESTDLSKLAL
jgi:hypothetical protein